MIPPACTMARPGRPGIIASPWQAGQAKPAPAFFAAARRCGRHPGDATLVDSNPEATGASGRQARWPTRPLPFLRAHPGSTQPTLRARIG
jgi:hypothetical protein